MRDEECPPDEEPAINSADVFAAPPADEEVDQRIAADPWILRKRLTFEAYATRCRQAGRQPDWREWMDHSGLDEVELQLLKDHIEGMRERHCDELGPCFILQEYGNKARVGWFNERGELVTMSPAEFAIGRAHMDIEIGHDKDGRPIMKPLVPYWLRHPLTRRYKTVVFRPGVDQADMPADQLNLWRNWPIGLTPGWDDYRLTVNGSEPLTNGEFDGPEMPPGYCDRFLGHMRDCMCGGDEEVLHYVLGWMADALWNPGPCATAIVMRGPEGGGKSLWAKHFMEFHAPHGITLNRPQQLTGNFNKHLMDKSVVFADEAFFAGNRQDAATLKTLITDDEIFIEPKGVDGFMAKKSFRLIIASNNEHVIRAGREDRRYLVLTVDAGEHNDDKPYFNALIDEWNGGGRRALFRWLTGAWWGKAVGEGRFRLWPRPITAGLQEQKDMSLPPAQMLVQNMLREGEVPSLHMADARRDAVFVATDPLKDAGRLRANEHRALADALRILAGEGARTAREYLGSGGERRQYRGYWLPSLEECRRRWASFQGREIMWPADVTGWDFRPLPEPPDDLPF